MSLYSRKTQNQKYPFSGRSEARTILPVIWPALQIDLSGDPGLTKRCKSQNHCQTIPFWSDQKHWLMVSEQLV